MLSLVRSSLVTLCFLLLPGQDALKLALTAGDRPTHARCLAILADIHRQCLDVQVSSLVSYGILLVFTDHSVDPSTVVLQSSGQLVSTEPSGKPFHIDLQQNSLEFILANILILNCQSLLNKIRSG